MDNLGGDNKQQNSPAEIYANVRDRALEEAAKECERMADLYERTAAEEQAKGAENCAHFIRALKRNP